ncbi:MAG: 30S ribosomal protein S20 [Gammaproteobacteria bacterium]|nr:30S ribosomal protein S20 [Gammaproteobacteria bacterium]MYF62594.1 30S ribosomal protein S20 [Gammaproteobacteria bacterium]
MPNVKSAIKRMNKSREQNARNRAKRSRLRTALKKVREATDAETAQARFREAQVLLDRAATSRLLHPNAVARMKSALARQVNALG